MSKPLIHNPHSLFHSIQTVFTASLVVQILSIIKGFVIAYLLGPTLLGVWRMVTIIFSYLEYAQFGIVKSLNIDLVLSIGRGESDTVQVIKNQVFSWLVILAIGWILIINLIELTGIYHFQSILHYLTLYMCLFLPLIYMFRFLTEILKAEQRFPVLNRIKLIHGFLLFAASLVGAYYYGVQGLAIAAILVTAIVVVINFYMQKTEVHWKMDWNLSKTLFLSGGGGMISELATILFLTVDGVMIYHLLGKPHLGVYALAVQLVALINFAASAITQVFHPTIGYEVGSGSNNPNLLIRYLTCGSLLTWMVALIGFGASILIYPVVITSFFTEFDRSIFLSQVLSFGMLFLSLRLIYASFLLVSKSFILLNGVLIFGIFLNMGFNYWVYTMGYGINGFAVVTAVSQILLGLVIMLFAGRIGPPGTLSALLRELGRQLVLLVTGLILLVAFFWIFQSHNYRDWIGIGYFLIYVGGVVGVAYLITPKEYWQTLLSTRRKAAQ